MIWDYTPCSCGCRTPDAPDQCGCPQCSPGPGIDFRAGYRDVSYQERSERRRMETLLAATEPLTPTQRQELDVLIIKHAADTRV